MKTILILTIANILISSTALASGYKIYLENNQTVMAILVEPAATGAVGIYSVERYNSYGASYIVSFDQIVSGSMELPISQPRQAHSVPPYFLLSSAKNGTIEIKYLNSTQCKVTTKNIIGFKFGNRILGCSIIPYTDGVPGAFSGSN